MRASLGIVVVGGVQVAAAGPGAAQGLLNKANALRRFHRLGEAASAYDDLTAQFGGDDDPRIEALVAEARRAQKWLRRHWWQWITSW
jgi:hypothetical protein